jgi:hypothetical protein
MIFKQCRHFSLVSFSLLLFCSTDPVTIDTSRMPRSDPLFNENGLLSMIADPSGDFFALSRSSYIYRIVPDSADTSGNCVYLFDYSNSYISSLFYDDSNRIAMINGLGISTLDQNFQWTNRVSFTDHIYPSGSDVSVDWKKQCFYLKHATVTHYDIYQYANGNVRLCTGGNIRFGSSELYSTFFAAADSQFAVAYNNYSLETWLAMFTNDSLSREIRLFGESDTCTIRNLLYVGKDLYVVYFDYPYSHKTIKVDQQGTSSQVPASLRRYYSSYNDRTYYRSSKETWLWNDCGYLVAEPDTVVWKEFRLDSYINRFNVICFKDSSEVIFFDEATQHFVKQ